MSGRLCAMCKAALTLPNSGYCKPCSHHRYLTIYRPARWAKRGVAGVTAQERNECNCGDRKCDGLSCEVVRV